MILNSVIGWSASKCYIFKDIKETLLTVVKILEHLP